MTASAMHLCSKHEAIVRRVRDFTLHAADGALINVDLGGSGFPLPPRTSFTEWQFPGDMYRYLDQQIELLLATWSAKDGIDDDAVPLLYPRFGIAEHSAFVGGLVEFGADTSYAHPCIQNVEDLSGLSLRDDHPWLRMVIDGSRYLAEKSNGRFAVMQRGAMSPLDLANALRGNDLFMDFYDAPEAVMRLLDFCTIACAFYIDRQKRAVPGLCDGVYSGCYVWMPGDAYGHLSEDASVLCSAAQYREFGRPFTERLARQHERIFMHLHTAGVRAFPDILSIPQIEFCELANDPGEPRGIEVVRNHRDLFAGKILKLFVTPDEIRANRDLLREIKTVLFCTVRTREEGLAAVDFVRRELSAR